MAHDPGAAPAPGTAMWDAVARFDAQVEAWVEPLRDVRLDPVMYALSSAADHSYLWHTLAWLQAHRTHDTRAAARMSLALGIESALTNGVIKSCFRRVRPRTHAPGTALPYGMRVPVTSSFPSGHATAAFTAAAFLTAGDGHRLRWYSLAALVASSRVYVRMHHPSDVVAGAALGVGFAALLPRIVRRLLP